MKLSYFKLTATFRPAEPQRIALCRARVMPMRHSGPRWRNCGASGEQQQIGAGLTNLFGNLTNAFNTAFGGSQDIINTLTAQFKPILEAGPDQFGFSPAETAALRSASSDNTALGENKAQEAAAAEEAGAGGGDSFTPTGQSAQIAGHIAESGTEEGAKEQQQITEAGYATGRQQFAQAEGALSTAAQLENPAAFGSEAINAGGAANTVQKDISEENDAWMQPLFGLVGGLGSAALKNRF